jgi:pimeloyl-ACP methyl ester carboxylesterase
MGRAVKPTPLDESCVLLDGAWTHRVVSANGSRFHIVEAGTGPLVLFLHGFPEFWAAWQHQLSVLAGAGFRAVATDLRGYGASDKPPRGYDGYTQTADVAGIIRTLGERNATLVGSGFGGLLAWATAALQPRYVRRLVVVGAAHPLRLRTAIFAEPRAQLTAAGPVLKFQLPRYEHVLTRDNAALVGAYLRSWSGPGWVGSTDFVEYERLCRTAFQIPQVAFCALESFRWGMRSLLRLRGHRFRPQLREPNVAPTPPLHGSAATVVLPSTAQGTGRYEIAPYDWRLLHGVGHFAHREAPDLLSSEILRWSKE